MSQARPDPEGLLAEARREETRAGRGRLKIFFGMAPGVGKTYAMLAAAHRMAGEGHDVVVGIVETHGRSETEGLLLGLDLLPRRSVEYRGIVLEELDVDRALARKPEILLVDELAHTNAPGGRFEKRWQDVNELLAAGISVFTTLNVQHIESLNDVVAQITGVQVRETVPDSVVEEADEIELVDLPPDALLERLRAGKVYVPEAIKHAIDSFFRKGNLTALRQLSLRRTAEWVDQRMQEIRERQGVHEVWPAVDRVLVCVSPSPTSADLVRAARRMAAGLRAELLAVYIDTPRSARLRQADRDRLLQTLRLAESLGAETVTLSTPAGSSDPVRELISFARARNVTRIVLGKTERPRWRTSLFGSFMEEVIRQSGEIDVHVMRGEGPERASEAASAPALRADVASGARPGRWSGAAGALLVVTGATALASLVFAPPDLSEEAMVYLAAVIVTAWRFGRWPSVLASVLGVLSFNFFFTDPPYTLHVTDPRYLVTFAVMLVVGLLVGTLTARTREQAGAASERERRTASLYAMSRELTMVGDEESVAKIGVKHVGETFGADAAILLPPRSAGRAAAREEGQAGTGAGGVSMLERIAASGSPDWLDEREASVARWAFDRGESAGRGTRVLPGGTGRHVPLTTSRGKLGVLSLRPHDPAWLASTPHLLLLDTFVDQIAVALECVLLVEGRQVAQVEAERERLRNALLSSVSHDLRTPLASIAGSASALAEGVTAFDGETRRELSQSIVDEANRLNDLIGNLVFATRLESGIDVRREWTTIEEIVGAGLARHREAIARRSFTTSIPSDLPMIRVDAVMLAQVVSNLVDNALRYTPEGSPVRIMAWATDQSVIVQVADEGPGLAEGERDQVFQRHYRGSAARSRVGGSRQQAGGMGLGLTICEGIVTAHGGRLWAEANVPRGTLFMFALPIERPQPRVPHDDDDDARPPGSAPERAGGKPMSASAKSPLVLVIEDEAPIRKFLRATLVAHGFRVNEAATAREGEIQAGMEPPELIILDLGLPDGDGLDVIERLREWLRAPIVVLSARGQEQDKVVALDRGADDYLTKPFGVAELMARLRVALRHAAATSDAGEPVYECERNGRTLRVDLSKRTVHLTDAQGEREVRLTPTEFKLLALLVKHAGKVLTQRQLLTEVWGPPHASDVQYLRVYAGQLRQKLEADPAQPRFLLTEPGVGYRLVEPAP